MNASDDLPCGHPVGCNVISAETGKILYCGWCNAVSFQRDLRNDETIRAERYRVLLEEAKKEFSRVLVATSDNERVYDWLKRVRQTLALDHRRRKA